MARGRFVMQLEPRNQATFRPKHHQSWLDGRGSAFGVALCRADSESLSTANRRSRPRGVNFIGCGPASVIFHIAISIGICALFSPSSSRESE